MKALQHDFFDTHNSGHVDAQLSPNLLKDELSRFSEFGKQTIVNSNSTIVNASNNETFHISYYINEFWTAKQRAAHSIHEISYRACFKPQLPRFFIERLTSPKDMVYDPFMGRGTTIIEAALLGRTPAGCDVNPLSQVIVRPRLEPPDINDIEKRLRTIDFDSPQDIPDDLLVFYHPRTLQHICALRNYLLHKAGNKSLDKVDRWIQMVAINRLTGHSRGFFSVYTMPPNQAVSVETQRKINSQRNQSPDERNISAIILKKTKSLQKDLTRTDLERLTSASLRSLLLTGQSSNTPDIPSESVSLVVTSPPFLDVVDYAGDNWLRCWFLGIDAQSLAITMSRKLADWMNNMTAVLKEVCRVLKPGGYVAFEVGEVRGGKVRLEEAVVPCGISAGLGPVLVLINDQKFTKTANCWGVDNNSKGTNTNRIIVFQKPPT
ncbi:MAG: site-specific DNA-methyltransferase [Deltaproteobacteria bacterium]|nr:site-specific DNA-methyltransferase [Deltaproteobacteria bacterium]